MNSAFTYTAGKLTISISTSDPAALHEQLLKGLTASCRNYILSNDGKNKDKDGQFALLRLLDCLLPDEKMLSKINE